MSTENSKKPNYETKTRELVAQLRQDNPNPEAEALQILAAACGSAHFDVLTRSDRESFANHLLEQSKFMRHFLE